MLLGNAMIQVKALTFGYEAHPLFCDLHFTVEAGQCLHIQGCNGVGKTTVLKVLLGLLRPHAGEILWHQKSMVDHLESYLDQVVYIGHQNGLTRALTLQENIQLDWHYGPAIQNALAAGLQALALENYLMTTVATLSKGQQRKAALLRLWMTQARLWILDEPFASLDSQAQAHVEQRMQKHLDIGGGIVMTSHQPVHQLAPVKQVLLS